MHAWASAAQQHLSTSCLETELRETLFLYQQNSSTPAHLSIPSMQREIILLAASHLLAYSVRLRIPEEPSGLQKANLKATWRQRKPTLLWILLNFSALVHYQNVTIAMAHSKEFIEMRKAGCKIYRAPEQFTVIQATSSRVNDAGSFPTPDPLVRF